MFYLHHIFRSFLPLQNPIGFGAADFGELFAAVALVCAALIWPRSKQVVAYLTNRPAWTMALLFALPIVLRLALIHVHPIPTPAVADDFSYLLLGDTFSHFRLANPTHPLHAFFETFFILQQPTYSSIYPPGQGIALAIGQVIFGNAWAGVAISIGLFCSLCYWMLRGWTTPAWALLGGILAVIEFGPLNQWMNSFWGGAVSAIAGCLVFGALPRLIQFRQKRYALVAGAGLGLQLLSRPFESILLVVAAALFMLPHWKSIARLVPLILVSMLPAIGLMLAHNKRATGKWLTLPYEISREQYGVPTTFTFQSVPIPHRPLTREQQLDYQIQSAVHGSGPETIGTYIRRLLDRARFYRFFFLAPLYIALPFFLIRAREFRWVIATLALFALGTTFYPYFYSHYIAAITCLLVLATVIGLERAGPLAAPLIVFVCVAQFELWYTVHAIGDADMWRLETWDAINYGDPESRISVRRQLLSQDGNHLVLVRYGPQHTFKEWVFNSADIDGQKIVWARDLGPTENKKLLQYYRERRVWLLEPDTQPVRLTPYVLPVEQPATPPPKPARPHLKFEEVH
jgi:hypothetical protein